MTKDEIRARLVTLDKTVIKLQVEMRELWHDLADAEDE